jgi:hypothetical protein
MAQKFSQVLQVNQFLYDLKKAFQLDSPTSKFPKLQYTEGSSNEILTSLKSQAIYYEYFMI